MIRKQRPSLKKPSPLRRRKFGWDNLIHAQRRIVQAGRSSLRIAMPSGLTEDELLA